MSVIIVWDILVLVELYWATLKTTVFHGDHCNFRGAVGFVTRFHFVTRHIKLETTDPLLKTKLTQHHTYVSCIRVNSLATICFGAFGAVHVSSSAATVPHMPAERNWFLGTSLLLFKLHGKIG